MDTSLVLSIPARPRIYNNSDRGVLSNAIGPMIDQETVVAVLGASAVCADCSLLWQDYPCSLSV